ncbi:MAG: hypothetical protein K6E50_07800 [Lachnospiraceae bacterium]|nr:hypothetical protein [Lachnospiraceae bacterium]
MKKLRFSQWILLAGFVLGICLPLPLWMLIGSKAASSGSEMRMLAERPVLTAENYAEYPGLFEEYLGDHLPFKDALVAGNAATDYLLFRSSSDRVIVGKEDWLFYAAKMDGDPVSDYQGSVLYGKKQLASIAERLCAQRDKLAAEGTRFVIFFAPNKERVYAEYMPEQYGAPAEEYRLKQLADYLQENTDLEVVNSLEAVLQAKNETEAPLWYKTDTHWNDLGAYVGSRELLGTLGIELPALSECTVEAGEPTSGDLARILHLESLFEKKDREYRIAEFELRCEIQAEEGYHAGVNAHAEGADPRRIYFCRDSYADAMIAYVGNCFTDSRFVYRAFYTEEDRKAFAPDIFVYEIVERYLNELL